MTFDEGFIYFDSDLIYTAEKMIHIPKKSNKLGCCISSEDLDGRYC